LNGFIADAPKSFTNKAFYKMEKRPLYQEPLSTMLRRHPHGRKTEIASTVRWVALTSLFLFLTLIISFLLTGKFMSALVAAFGILPILVSIILLRQDAVTLPSTLMATTIILLITWLATLGQGIHDIGILGFPVILIVAGLILRGRVIMYLAFFIILCMGWLGFGEQYGWYHPTVNIYGGIGDFFIGSIIVLIAGNAVYRLVRNVYLNLSQAEDEIAMRQLAEKEREAVIQKLKSKNQELDRFAVRVSHDLKTPLITVAGFLGFLEKDIKEGNHERVERNVAQISEAAKKMGKFVDELLDLSRVGRIVNPPTNVAFDEIVQDALNAAEGVLKARQVRVKIEAIFPFVHVDRVRLVQVMQNLITNAIKFMGDQAQPVIRIGFEEINGEHIFSVSDNGIGIAKEHQERIFELFSKLDPNTDGIGIGLGLVKRIVETHGGRIWVESEGEGKGSTFKFTLQKQPDIKFSQPL
jgi:signal transduction histidine kinase